MTNPTTITGARGELVARLIQLLRGDDSEPDTDRVINLGFWAEFAVGNNSPLPGVVVVADVNEPPTPGTMLERRLQGRRAVTAAQWLELMQERLLELVDFGVEEAFLVVALRDKIAGYVSQFADVGATAEKRARGRAEMLAFADDEQHLERFRAEMAKENPAYADKPLEDIAEDFRERAERLLQDPTADEAKARWAEQQAWDRDVDTFLSDELIDRWMQRRLHRSSGDGL